VERSLSPALRLGLALASALAFSLAFPPFGWFPLAWIALVPLFLALRGAGALGGAALAFPWIVGLGLGIARWLPGSILSFFATDVVLAWVAALGVFAFAGCFVAMFSAWLGWASRRRMPGPLAVGAAWALVEWARATFWIPNPWGMAAYSQAGWLPAIQVADLGGVPLVSFVIASVNAAFAELVASPAAFGERVRRAVPAAVCLALSLGYGAWRLAEKPGQSESFTVALVQPAIERERDWNPAYRDANLERYLALTAKAASQHPDLVIWPEGAIDFSPRQDRARRERLLEASRALPGDLLLGGPDRRVAYSFAQEFNAAFLLRAGELAGIYDKVELMPFAESNPLRGLVARVGRELTAGREPRMLESRVGKLGVLLCSEIASASAARERARLGAQVLVNPASDRWFPVPSAAAQHLQMAVFRAVETRRPVLRISSRSSSAAIDRFGRIEAVPAEATVVVLPLEPGGAAAFDSSSRATLSIAALLLALSRRIRS
jgi:apolipoprotein N-acyltransferase